MSFYSFLSPILPTHRHSGFLQVWNVNREKRTKIVSIWMRESVCVIWLIEIDGMTSCRTSFAVFRVSVALSFFPRLTLTVFQFSMESSSTHGNNIVKIRARGKKSKRKSHSPPFIVCQHERTSRYSSPACIRSFRSGYRIAVLSSSGGCWMGWACMPANIFRIGLFCVQNICTEIHTFPRPSPSTPDSARAHGMHWVGDATFIFHTSEDRTAQQLVLPDWEKRVQTATTYFYSPFFVRRQKYIFSLGSNIFRYSFRKHRRESEPERAACVSVCVF